MAESRVFKLMNGVTLEMLGEAVEGFLRDSKGMQTQAGQTTGGYLIQGRQEADGWKRISGTDQAISVQMFKAEDVVNVTTGFGKWSDKIGAGVVGYFVFAPLAITAAIGAFLQKKLPGEIFDFIEKFILSGGQSAAIGMSVGRMLNQDEVICKHCKTANQKGKKYDFTYIAGEPKDLINQLKGLDLGDKPGHWMVMTRDLWKDFGNITLTGMSFICPERRDAGFDEIFLAKTQDDIKNAPKVLPSEVATVVPAVEEDDELMYDEAVSDSIAADQGVHIDWGAQIKAGGTMMYPLYLLGLIALVIAIQRLITSRQGRLAPKPLCKSVNECLANGDLKGALAACDKYPSTLANSLRFIFEHVKAGREAVSQTAGDMAARDIRTHLARIYPLSVIASLAPLIGLLGTVVGMIEAFGLVALYGDEGGASILSDSISKALITTAAGLIIAAPAIALYFIIKNRIMRMASLVEVKVEEVITKLYLDNKEEKNETEL